MTKYIDNFALYNFVCILLNYKKYQVIIKLFYLLSRKSNYITIIPCSIIILNNNKHIIYLIQKIYIINFIR